MVCSDSVIYSGFNFNFQIDYHDIFMLKIQLEDWFLIYFFGLNSCSNSIHSSSFLSDLTMFTSYLFVIIFLNSFSKPMICVSFTKICRRCLLGALSRTSPSELTLWNLPLVDYYGLSLYFNYFYICYPDLESLIYHGYFEVFPWVLKRFIVI